MISIIKKIPLLNCEENLYTGVIFKNCFYNFLNPKFKLVDIYNCKLKKEHSINLCNGYKSITNSKNCNLFYTVKNDDDENLYIVDSKYNEIDKIKLNISNNYKSDIKSITYDEDKNKIIIALKNKVYSVTIDGDFIKEEISKSSLEKISTKYIKTNIVRGLNGCCQNTTSSIYEPYITSVGIFCNKLFITYIKDNSLYLSELSNNGNIVDTYYIDDNIEVNAIFDVNKNMQLLVTKQEKYNYIYITDYCCENKKCINNYCLICKDNFEEDCYLECENECNEECYLECENECRDYDADVIESIALIETALSHILNAEGEKIQKAVCLSDNVCDLIKTNDSVSKTITNITLLEQILLNKLELVHKKSCCFEECD
jgi:hypothetical protein